MNEILHKQQRQRFDQLARLKQLLMLDLGYLEGSPVGFHEKLLMYQGVGGHTCINYYGPFPPTLESGFDRLLTLTRLDVLGLRVWMTDWVDLSWYR